MNTKGMVISIVTALVVMTMFASSAMAITVDGRIDPSDEWNSWKLADDEDVGNPLPLVNGYNISAVWQHYDASEDKLYFRYDTVGIAGDSSGNGNPNTPADDQNDQWGVGVPHNPAVYHPREGYTVAINADNDINTGKYIRGYYGFDIILNYQNDTAAVEWIGIAEPSGFIAEAAIATAYPFTHVVEFSINNVSEYMDTRLYVLYGYAGSDMDQANPEDPLEEPIEVLEFDFNWTGICCYNMEFDGTDSFGNIKNHTWTFGDGQSEGPITGAPGVVTNQYSSGGAYPVKLSGYNYHGLYVETTKSVYVDKGPTAKATRTPWEIDANTLTSVTFDGSASHADPMGDPMRTITYKWEFSDSYPDQFTAVVTRDVTLGLEETLDATLTVDDTHCERSTTVTVGSKRPPIHKPPSDVPILTPTGMVALIGMLCIVGAGRILTKGRRS